MANLQQLPLELLRGVLDRLSRQDLLALSCASKSIRTAVEPTLYREITFNWEGNSKSHPPVHLLLRSVVSRPELASCIERLEFWGQKPYDDWKNCKWRRRLKIPVGPSRSIWTFDKKSAFPSADVMLLAASIIKSLDLPAENHWLEGLHRGEADVFIALLLSRTSKLRHLRLDSDFQWETGFVGSILTNAADMSQKPFLEALEHVDYSGNIENAFQITYHDVDLNQILPLFSMPSVRSVSMAVSAKDIVWPSQTAPKSFITSLTLHHTQLSEEMLGQLLLATPSLRFLGYQSWFDIDSGGRPGRAHWEFFDCAKLGQSLSYVQHSLEHLVISVQFVSLQTDVALGGFRGMAGKLDTLNGFKKLHSLVIPSIVLLGWTVDSPRKMGDILPLSLRHLCLTDDLHELGEDKWGDEALLPLIQEFLEERSFSASKLESISLLLNQSQTEWCEEARVKLKSICERARIQCSIGKMSNDLPMGRPDPIT